MHESVWGISDSDHNTAQLALLPSGHLEHLDLDLVGSLIVLMDSTVDATCLIHVNNRRRWAFCWDVSICPASWFWWWRLGMPSLVMVSDLRTWWLLYRVMFVITGVLPPTPAPGATSSLCAVLGQHFYLPSLHVLTMWCREDPHLNRQSLLFVVTISAYKLLQALPVSSPILCCTTHSSLFMWQGMYFILWGSHQHSLFQNVRV